MSIFRDAFLLREWIATNREFGLGPNLREFQYLRACHSEPGRFYHTFEHIAECIRFANSNYGNRPTLPIVKWALFYHDVIYDISSKTNEEDSALRFDSFARPKVTGIKLTEGILDLVGMLIRVTAGHKSHLMGDAIAMMIDSDLHILGASEERYLRYARDIWREYSSVGVEKYREGRLAFLYSLNPLELFHTTEGKLLISRVFHNIELEKRLLEAKIPSFLS